MGSEVSKASLEHGLLHGFYKQAGLSSCLKCKGFECISSAQGASPTNSELLHSCLDIAQQEVSMSVPFDK